MTRRNINQRAFTAVFAIIFIVVCGNCERKATAVNGRYTRGITDYQLTVPYKIGKTGKFITHTLESFFDQSSEWNDALRYSINFNERNYVLELLPNHRFLSAAMLLDEKKKLCYFTGHVSGVSSSKAALSTCHGIVGFIHLPGKGRYFIEPLEGQFAPHESHQNGQILHIIHKQHERSSHKEFCGTTGWLQGWQNAIKYHHEKTSPDDVYEGKKGSSNHYYIELIIAVDRTFIEFHDSDVEHYVLTIMNMVSDFYHDATFKYQIDVTIAKIINLHELKIDTRNDAEGLLESFCKWQAMTREQSNHDVAILLTREDICMRGDCDLLGLAHVASACVPERSCAISEDNGLELGVTVSHEIGHLLGCDHDNDNECPMAHSVMAPSLSNMSGKWSECSQFYISELFNKNLGECLKNNPNFRNEIIDASQQCKVLFGERATFCEWMRDEICQRLYCRLGEKCVTLKQPPVDGTSCGPDKWCINNQCVNKLKSVAMSESTWGEWSTCSRECGGGIQISHRKCNKSRCDGDSKRYRMCNKSPCAEGTPSYRDEQCGKFNHFHERWLASIENDEHACGLYCVNQSGEKVVKFRERADDGTPCKIGTNNVCIEGKCVTVGCDWQFYSNATKDECGICNGNGKNCKIINGTKIFNLKDDDEFLVLPKNARNVVIKMLMPSKSRLVLMNAATRTEFLMNYKTSMNSDEIALTHMLEENKEEIFIKGPLRHELLAYVKHRDRRLVKIRYRYAMKDNERTIESEQEYSWNYILPNGKCTFRCDGGVQEISAICVSNPSGSVVSDNYCKKHQPRPPSRFKLCNAHSCRYEWQMSHWSECNGCVQMRNVWCGHERAEWNEQPAHVDDKECLNTSKKPETIKQCEDSEIVREMREANGNKLAKCLNIFKLKSPDASVASSNEEKIAINIEKLLHDNDDFEKEDAEIENTAGSAEKLPTTTMRAIDRNSHSSQPEFFIIHRFHPLVNHRSLEKRVDVMKRGQRAIDETPEENNVIEEIPISFEKETLDGEHVEAIQNPESS